MSFNATRLTCFALISAIELDFRDLILSLESDHDITWPSTTVETAERRRQRDRLSAKSASHTELIDFLDFADSYQILLGNKKALETSVLKSLTSIAPFLERLIAVRNRVAHSRPMEIDDLSTTHDVAQLLVQSSGHSWSALSATVERLAKDPSYVLGLTIELPKDPRSQSLHNLPIPDFDETGFFGRGRELKRIKKAILGPWPVVSILGDGGIGKTAIALRAAYDLLDDPAANFEAVVWVTAKATTLTSGEIQNIGGAIQNSLGMFEAAAIELGASDGESEDPAEEVLDYLATFRILLILDNLETVTDQRLRDFLLDMPNGSKVLITSRIGLGIENPVKLEPLTDDESRSLLRALASIRNVDLLKSLDEPGLNKLVAKLKGHPLYIKWLVAGVQSGKRPSDLVNDNSLLLDFCMSNVYDKLGQNARKVLQSMQVVRGPRGQGELAYLNEFNAQEVQSALLELLTTNFVSMGRSGADSLDGSYETGDFASQYLARHQPVTPKLRDSVNSRSQTLADLGLKMKSVGRSDRYSVNSLDIRGQHDVPAAKLLLDAQRQLRDGNFDEAINLCHEAQTLSPTYHEAWRVEAVVHERRQDRYSTLEAFERAYELAEHSEVVGYHYGVYLCDGANEYERGLAILQAAARLDSESPQLIHQIAWAHFYLENYLGVVDSCRALAARSQNPIYTAANVELALRAGVFGAERLLWTNELADAAVLIEASLQFVLSLRIEQIDPSNADWLMRLTVLSTRLASNATNDDFLKRRASEFAAQFTDRVRILDASYLNRETAQVAHIDKDKHFGFINQGSQRYFFHHNDLLVRNEWSSISEATLVAFTPDLKHPRGPRATALRALV
jgi:cold shock CspA family protein